MVSSAWTPALTVAKAVRLLLRDQFGLDSEFQKQNKHKPESKKKKKSKSTQKKQISQTWWHVLLVPTAKESDGPMNSWVPDQQDRQNLGVMQDGYLVDKGREETGIRVAFMDG